MRSLLSMIWIGILVQGYGQSSSSNAEAVRVLKKVSEKLDQASPVSYQYTMETRYYADNYHFVRNAGMYLEYITRSPVGLRFQAREENALFVYNGVQTLRMDLAGKTIDSATANTTAKMENNSYLYHSLAMLRNILPLVISNDTIQKNVQDTVVDGKKLYSIKIERPKMYFRLFQGIAFVQVDNLQRPYYLLVDRNTYLPYQFVARYIRGNDDRDFVTVTYRNIDLHPRVPAANSWQYAAYANHYKPFKSAEKKPMIKPGTAMAGFTLPGYTPEQMDSVSLHQFAGKVVLLDFWFKSCGPCMEAMPHYNDLQNKFANEGFQLLTINIEDGPDDMKFFYNKFQPLYKMLFRGGKLFESLGLPGCPSSVLLDRSGKVIQAFVGFNQADLEKKIGEALAL